MSNLSHYNQNQNDRTYPDHEETVLGHMVFEMGVPLSDAAQRLKPWVKSHTKQADRAKTIGLFLTGGGIVGSITLAATLGIGVGSGFGAIAPFVAGLWNLTHKLQSDKEHTARDAEYLLLSTCPELVKLIYGLAQRGMPREVIVEAYDDLVHNFQANYSQINATGCLDGIDLGKEGIGQAFKDLIEEKMNMEVFSQEVVAEFDQFNFTTLYQSESKKALPSARAADMAAVIPSTKKDQTIADYIETTKPDRDVESAVKQSQSVTAPTKADILKMPLPDRADYLMRLLAEYGCDLRNLIARPTLAAGGLQRSGKTTLLLLVGILEKAKGNKLFYITRDNDLYPVAFDGYANGSTEEAMSALFALNTKISAGSMGSMTGQTWVLDEFSAISGLLPKPKQAEFWGMALTGFAKQGGRVRFAVHHKTATANGLPPGQAETFKAEIKMLWTDRTELSDGTYQPSGQYELLQEVAGYYKASGQTFQIPEWLLTEVNPAWHNAPCPVRSLLSFFPEFDTRKGAIAHPLNESKPKNPFDKSAPVERVQPTEPSNDPWQEYQINTQQMSLESLPPNPKVDKLISDLQNNSKDPRSPDFIDWLETLRTGQAIDEAVIDPQFVNIARHRKIISKEGVVI